ncbi:class I SAM-dependent methyltransferase [Acetobacterium wieringae]|uniref:class I SAM-dependent methyltransferase n=1 Tax=Acetobacterium wieringae TaxID=52694 RepID=UPI002B209B02|nr:class I SAM-dependent methyltransferase [Acetobacterium wieringae]MEA4804935.1 class I SAM-dependent methyltransferase [Acetobacterium wieringae]
MQFKTAYFEELWLSDNQKKEPTAEFWDFRAEEYNLSSSTEDAQLNRKDKVQALIDKGIITSDTTVLDIGCGPGQFAVELAKKAKKVVGLDFSKKMVDYARENAAAAGLQNAEFIHSDWDSFHDLESFDLVIASMSPAICKPEHLYKMICASRGFCYLSSFVERHSCLKETLYTLTDQKYIRQFNKLNYIFNILWTKGIFPELTYETGLHKRVYPLEKAKGIYIRELAILENPDQLMLVQQYLEKVAENGVVTEVLQQRKGELIWEIV